MRLFRWVVLSAAVFSLAGCLDSGSSGGGSGAVGVAATGHPLVGVTVTATDANGNTATSAVTDAGGNYSLSLSGLTFPVMVQAPYTNINGQPDILSSVMVDGSSSITNLTPITTLIVNRALGKALSGAPAAGQVASLTAAKLSSAQSDIVTALQPLLASQGVTQHDFIHDKYSADGVDRLDRLFDYVRIDTVAGTVSIARTLVNVPAAGSVDPASKITPAMLGAIAALDAGPTITPIKNIIVVVGENRTFDSIYGAYQPKAGNTIGNLLSKGIINSDGTPGPNFYLAAQSQAVEGGTYSIAPSRTAAYATLPQPLMTGVYGANLQPVGNIPDTRFTTALPNGPFQISKYIPYNPASASITAVPATFSADPVHRFFQMWQQTGGTNAAQDLFVWVATTTGQGGDTTTDGGTTGASIGITPANPGQGGELMGFYNVNSGDAPLFKSLADSFALSDNYHQSVMGGTGMNFFSLGTGDMPVYNVNGTPATPPSNQIENPNALAGTANFYTHDGYEGGSYVNCSDPSQPGVAAILAALSNTAAKSNCQSGAYYLVNNYNPPYNLDGSSATLGATSYVYPPQSATTVGETLASNNVTWKWYLGGRDPADVTNDPIYPLVAAQVAASVPAGTPASIVSALAFSETQALVTNILGDPHLASKNVMTGNLKSNLVGLNTFFTDAAAGTLPAVSFVVPTNLDSGHPGDSSPVLLEAFLNTLIAQVQKSPQWNSTAIVITTDEGGGYFDTGKIQMLDFFGDGPRIPLLVVSNYAKNGYVDHVYHDHGSILKFIERNWRLKPLSPRSRDRLPNPVALAKDPYTPANGPAIGDLMTMFSF